MPIYTFAATVLIPSLTTLGTVLIVSSQGNMMGLPKLHPAAVNSNSSPTAHAGSWTGCWYHHHSCCFCQLSYVWASLLFSPQLCGSCLQLSPCVRNQQPGTQAFPELTCKQVTQSICYHLTFSPVWFWISFSFFLLEGMCHTSSQTVPLAFCRLITLLIIYLSGGDRESCFRITSNFFFFFKYKVPAHNFIFFFFLQSSDV